MNYIQITFSFEAIEEYQKDILVGELAEVGFDTFEDTDKGFAGFAAADQYNEQQLKDVLAACAGDLNYTYDIAEIAGKNWNEEWEKNFDPIEVESSPKETGSLAATVPARRKEAVSKSNAFFMNVNINV